MLKNTRPLVAELLATPMPGGDPLGFSNSSDGSILDDLPMCDAKLHNGRYYPFE